MREKLKEAAMCVAKGAAALLVTAFIWHFITYNFLSRFPW